MESTAPRPREGGGGEARAGGPPRGGLLDSQYPTISCALTAMDREARDRRDEGEVAVCWPCGPILARSLVSFGREDVLQTLKNEVMARKNPDFCFCSTKPKVVATPGPYVLVAAFGAEEGVLNSSCCPLGVWVTDSMVSFLFLIAQMGRLRRREGARRDLVQDQGRARPWSWPDCSPFLLPTPPWFPPEDRGILPPAL